MTRSLMVAAASVLISAGSVCAQEQRTILFEGVLTNTPLRAETDSAGRLVAEAPFFRSFQSMKFKISGRTGGLGIEYECMYAFGPYRDLYQEKRANDQPCPTRGGEFVRAIRFWLTGPEADNYKLTAQCYVARFPEQRSAGLLVPEQRMETLAPVRAGELCGHGRKEGTRVEWITRIELTLEQS